jgi:hypothetical protein
LFFIGARAHSGLLITAARSRADEKQKEYVDVAFYKQATTDVVGTAKEKFLQGSRPPAFCILFSALPGAIGSPRA